MDNLICIIDFNGYTAMGHFPTAYWADYSLDDKTIYFGGDWQEIPPKYYDSVPDEDDIYKYVQSWLALNDEA